MSVRVPYYKLFQFPRGLTLDLDDLRIKFWNVIFQFPRGLTRISEVQGVERVRRIFQFPRGLTNIPAKILGIVQGSNAFNSLED